MRFMRLPALLFACHIFLSIPTCAVARERSADRGFVLHKLVTHRAAQRDPAILNQLDGHLFADLVSDLVLFAEAQQVLVVQIPEKHAQSHKEPYQSKRLLAGRHLQSGRRSMKKIREEIHIFRTREKEYYSWK